MIISVYNSLSQKKEELKKTAKKLKLFVCGPTVYDNSHIGHARTYVAFDIIVHYLRNRGHQIFYLQNITNIDDKIIARARGENKNPLKIAAFYEKEYYQSLKNLNVSSVDKYALASRYIKEIVRQVQTLIRKGFAYEIKGNGWYFDIAKFSDYGKLSKRTVSQAEDSLSRIDENLEKKNKGDFCLWKFVSIGNLQPKTYNLKPKTYALVNGEPAWRTILGWGRPGWHIEDTAISESFFGSQYDIHGGGIDLKFPHHEAEIAQQEAASGKIPFVKFWMHTGHLFVSGEKMSKSLKNFITIKEFIDKFENIKNASDIFRMMVFSHHYRAPMNYTEELSLNAKKSLNSIKEFISKLDFISARSKNKNQVEISDILFKSENKFHKAMADDFNTPSALAVIFDLINVVNKNIWGLSKKDAVLARKFIVSTFQLLGFRLFMPKIPAKINKLAEIRELCRANKQFTQSDALRKKIKALGFEIEDTPFGPFIASR